jgi:Tfp pilus assembly protein PilN
VRPVNLIPKEERTEGVRPMRSGPTAYIVLGALVAALLGVTALVTTNNRISDLKAESTRLEADIASTEAEAQELQAYVDFQSVREQRVSTVTSLADSRFDWERVMRELALILPDDVLLTSLTASASPGVGPGGAAAVSLRSSIPGPALEINGCAKGHEGVAGFIQAIKDIDGVTRVAVPSSSEGGELSAETGSAAETTACDVDAVTATFQMVVAFDAAPLPAASAEALPEVAASSPEAETPAEGAEE